MKKLLVLSLLISAPYLKGMHKETESLPSILCAPDSLKPYACDHPGCDYRSAHKGSVERHKRTHTGERPYTCSWPDCEEKFAQSCDLTRHIRIVHMQEKKYKCPLCKDRFPTKQNLENHQAAHTGEKPLCRQCGKRFEKAALKEHVEKKHPITCHECENCGKKYANKQNLRRHVERDHLTSSMLGKRKNIEKQQTMPPSKHRAEPILCLLTPAPLAEFESH